MLDSELTQLTCMTSQFLQPPTLRKTFLFSTVNKLGHSHTVSGQPIQIANLRVLTLTPYRSIRSNTYLPSETPWRPTLYTALWDSLRHGSIKIYCPLSITSQISWRRESTHTHIYTHMTFTSTCWHDAKITYGLYLTRGQNEHLLEMGGKPSWTQEDQNGWTERDMEVGKRKQDRDLLRWENRGA